MSVEIKQCAGKLGAVVYNIIWSEVPEKAARSVGPRLNELQPLPSPFPNLPLYRRNCGTHPVTPPSTRKRSARYRRSENKQVFKSNLFACGVFLTAIIISRNSYVAISVSVASILLSVIEL